MAELERARLDTRRRRDSRVEALHDRLAELDDQQFERLLATLGQ